MGRSPRRTRHAYFIGAGFASAFGLPNTQQLLEEVHRLSDESDYWGTRKQLGPRLEEAYRAIYPIEAKARGFRPNVVDFFSVLKTFNDITSGFPASPITRPGELLRDLKRAIAFVLLRKLKVNENRIHEYREKLLPIVHPGSLVITSNWDLLLERAASILRVPLRYRLTQDPDSHVTLLKLHGSIDWATQDNVAQPRPGIPKDEVHIDDLEVSWPVDDYASLGESLFSNRKRRFPPRFLEFNEITLEWLEPLVRIRVHEDWNNAWRRIKSRSPEPLILTMGPGKSTRDNGLGGIWKDAYSAISRARQFEVIGYSLPSDDLEIRALLVAGLKRGTQGVRIVVKNPAPDVHERFRSHIDRRIVSDYLPM